jgi:hypothetical protein
VARNGREGDQEPLKNLVPCPNALGIATWDNAGEAPRSRRFRAPERHSTALVSRSFCRAATISPPEANLAHIADGALRSNCRPKLLADMGRGMIPTMGQDRTQQATPDLFSAAPGETSPPVTKQVVTSAPERRHILPKDLPNAIKHLTDQELDSLIAASLKEAKRRGRPLPNVQTDELFAKRSSRTNNSSHRRQEEVATGSLTRGQINAVRAAFKAGIKPSLISRQFGISPSDVRKVLASVTATHKGT